MKRSLPDGVSSPQDLTALLLEIQEYSRWFSHNSIKAQLKTKHATLPPTLSPPALELIRDASKKDLLNQQAIDTLIQELEAYKKTATTLTITLAAPPSSDLKKTLVAWCRQHITANVLVTFEFNSTLLGGMVIRYGSHIFDWSFRRQILAAHQNFPEVLRRV